MQVAILRIARKIHRTMGVLFLFTLTGFWLWMGPKLIRNKKRN